MPEERDCSWKILVVDDHPTNCELVVEILKGKAQCVVAINGKEALEEFGKAVGSDPFDLILLDISMPEMDGLEFLKTLRDQEAENGILLGDGAKVIMVTAHKERFAQAFRDGCDDYLVKPIDADLLLKKINRVLSE